MTFTVKDIIFNVYDNNNILTIKKGDLEPINIKYNYSYCNEKNTFDYLLRLISTTDFNITEDENTNLEYESLSKRYRDIIYTYLGIENVTYDDFIESKE